MPKVSDNYSRACIYSIKHNDEIIYIGSARSFDQRVDNHKCHYKKESKMLLYDYLRDNKIPWEDVVMEIYEEYPVLEGEPLEKKFSLERREREIIEELKPKCNRGRPARTRADYLEYQLKYYQEVRRQKPDYKEKCRENAKRYRDKQPKKIRESRGYQFIERTGKYVVNVNYQKQTHYVGCFDDEKSARQAYQNKCEELGKPYVNKLV